MSMGLSPSDILEAIKICKWIWDNCFDKNNTADQRYRKFGRDINGLQIQIGRVQDSIQSAIDELDPQERRSGNLEQELQDVAGNFLDTLERCKDLLNDRKYIGLKKDRAGFVTNIVWATTTPAKVDGLCREIQFHTQRLSLISKPVDTDLLVAIRRDLSEVVEWSRSQRPELRAQASELVPSWLRDVFATNITINPPPTVPDPRDIPMKAGCDILCRHYSGREHHDKITDPKRRIIHRYLTLFKCQWIINTLRAGSYYPRHRPGSPFRRLISNIELDISLDLQTSSHTRGAEIDEKELLDLQKESNEPFLIWDPPVLRQIVSPTDKEDDEEHILTLSLVTPESLLIFQNDRMCLRIVPTEETNGQVRLSRHHRGEVRFNARIDRFIALYTVLDPESEHANTVQIYHEGSRVPLTYNLKGLQDAWLFQQAVTGYEVKEHQMGVTWSAQKPVEAKKLRFRPSSRKLKMLGCVQILRWNPLVEKLLEDQAAPFDTSLLAAQPLFDSALLAAQLGERAVATPPSPPESLFHKSRNRTAPSIAPSYTSSFVREVGQTHGKHLELQPPAPPAIMFFGKSGATHVLYYMDLSRDHEIDPSSCRCSSTDDCPRLVIQHRARKNFEIRYISTEDSPASDWNLSTFRKLGNGDEYDRTILKSAECKYLELEFPTPEDRQDFSDRFEIEMGQYNETETAYYTYKETEKYMDDRPHRSPSNGKAASVYLDPSSRRSSFVSAFSQDPRRSPVRQRLSRIDSMDLDSKDGRT